MNPSSSSPFHPSPTGSGVKSICHHCDKTFERRYLNDQTKRMHPGRKPTEKIVECLSYLILLVCQIICLSVLANCLIINLIVYCCFEGKLSYQFD